MTPESFLFDNYQYSEIEIQQTVKKVDQMAKDVGEMHIVYNNNASDYAPRAAASFQEIAQKKSKNREVELPQTEELLR